MLKNRLCSLLVGVFLVLPACAGDDPDLTQSPAPADDSPTPAEGSPTPAEGSPTSQDGSDESGGNGNQIEWASCEHPEGIAVQYPQDWNVNAGDQLPTCSAFDPEPLDVPEAQEFVDTAVLLSVESIDFATASGSERTGNVLDRRETTVDGHDAVRVETESSGDALLQEGIRSTRWLIEWGTDRTITVVSNESADSGDYESHREILDLMVNRLQLPD